MRISLSTVAALSIGFPATPPAGSEPASLKSFSALRTLSWRSSKIKVCPFYNVPAAGRKSLRPRVKRCRHESWHWVNPKLVCQITRDDRLRQPNFPTTWPRTRCVRSLLAGRTGSTWAARRTKGSRHHIDRRTCRRLNLRVCDYLASVLPAQPIFRSIKSLTSRPAPRTLTAQGEERMKKATRSKSSTHQGQSTVGPFPWLNPQLKSAG